MVNTRFRTVQYVALAILTAFFCSAPLAGQTPAELKPLTPDTYDSWFSIVGTTISPDGKWVAYTRTPAVGDGIVVIRATDEAKEIHIPRGFTGRPLNTTYGEVFRPDDLKFTADGRRLIFLRYEKKADFDKTRRAHKPDVPPTVVAVDLASGSAVPIGYADAFTLPKNSSRYVLFCPPRDTTMRDSVPVGVAADPGALPRPIAKDSLKGRYIIPGVQLTIYDLQKGAPTRIDDVDSFVVDDDATVVAYAVSTNDKPTHDGVYLRRLGTTQDVTVMNGVGHYKGLTLDRKARQLAFTSDKDTYVLARQRYALYYTAVAQPHVRLAVANDQFGKDTILAAGGVRFSKNGAVIQFGVMPVQPDSIPSDSLADKAVYDLWNYQDPRLPTEQRTSAARDRARRYLTIYNVSTHAVIRVGNENTPGGIISDDGHWVCIADESPYEMASAWDDDAADLYLIDLTTGRRTVLAPQVPIGPISFSPGGRFITWFDRGAWYTHNLETGFTANATSAITSVRFDDETADTPSIPAPWGMAGWTRNDERLLAYSHYDVWSIDPKGIEPPVVVTDSLGARRQMIFRIVRPQISSADGEDTGTPNDSSFDTTQPVLLSAMNDVTKDAGFFQTPLGVRTTPLQLVLDTARIGLPIKARNTAMYVVTRETVRDFPNLYVGRNLASLARVSDVNPQQKEYRWPTAELVHWFNNDGVQLSGILYRPSDFDSTRQYPMIVYMYERMSDNLHTYYSPFGRNIVNPSVYTSHGYLVFEPDIKYTVGSPGMSVVKSVLPGVEALLSRGFVNVQAVGCAGQSWGGYEAAFLITQTKLFKACFVGAPVANMTSAYGAVRWENGHSRQFQYERSQSRIGGSLWDKRDQYIENSPLFYADRIETPLLIMANDHDGAVPWYQGIELFSAMRRFGKEAYMVSYNGDGHNPVKYANKKDIDMKMLQFFGHHLMGKPAPEWMVKGIPFLDKGRDQMPSGASPASP